MAGTLRRTLKTSHSELQAEDFGPPFMPWWFMYLIENGYCDKAVQALVSERPSLAVPWYLSAGLAYYAWDENIMHDATYDWLCGFLTVHWDEIQHRHKALIQRDPESGVIRSQDLVGL